MGRALTFDPPKKNSRQSVRKWEKFPLCGVDFLSRLCYNIPRSKEIAVQYGPRICGTLTIKSTEYRQRE